MDETQSRNPKSNNPPNQMLARRQLRAQQVNVWLFRKQTELGPNPGCKMDLASPLDKLRLLGGWQTTWASRGSVEMLPEPDSQQGPTNTTALASLGTHQALSSGVSHRRHSKSSTPSHRLTTALSPFMLTGDPVHPHDPPTAASLQTLLYPNPDEQHNRNIRPHGTGSAAAAHLPGAQPHGSDPLRPQGQGPCSPSQGTAF